LNENAKRINKSLGDLVGMTGFGFHIIEIEPGYDSTEHHVHYFEDECVYVLEGYEISEGDFIGFPAGGEALLNDQYGNTNVTLYRGGSEVGS
jgi:uncharacterized cupin superfamily protein